MKRLLYILIMCSLAGGVFAQPVNRWSVRVGEFCSYDPVLSPQQSSGVSITLNALHYAPYRDSSNVWWSFRDQFRYSPMLNDASSSRTHFGSVRLDYGTHYRFQLAHGLSLTAGGCLDIYGGIKYNTRNVNNIASADVQIGLRAMVSGHYEHDFSSKFGMGVHYGLSTPLIGCFFAPEYGESYYEIWLYLPESLGHTIHFSAPHNRQGVMGELMVDFMFPHGTLFVGFTHENEWWQTDACHFRQADIAGCVGFALRLQALRATH